MLARVSAAVVLLLLLVACGNDRPEETPTPTATVSTPTPTPAETPSPTPTPAATPTPTATPAPEPTPTPTPAGDTDPSSAAGPGPIPSPVPGVPEVSLLVVVDKERALPGGYVPPNLQLIPHAFIAPGQGDMLLRAEALDAYTRMHSAALSAGHDIRIRSAYRSYEVQTWTFNHWVEVHGEQEARRRSAPPGHSEHQLGTTVDVTVAELGWQLGQAFGDTAAGRWMADHAHEFGFALSYPESAEHITGYIYEPWHWRYIGEDAAQAWSASGLTLVEFLESVQ